LTREWVDAGLVVAILVASVGIGASREYSAESAAAALNARIRTRATVLRDGHPARVSLEEVVPGDVVLLAAGSLVPADAVVLEASDCHVNEAVLTGESFAVEKRPCVCPAGSSLSKRENTVFLGSNVRSGTAACLVVGTGTATEFGAIAGRLSLRPPESEFDRGLRHFGYLLTKVMLTMALLVFVGHVLLGRPPIETLLFAIALSVGLSPELLPAISSINLARGASMMASRGVLAPSERDREPGQHGRAVHGQDGHPHRGGRARRRWLRPRRRRVPPRAGARSAERGPRDRTAEPAR
jgi:Mg2+-importing ATPase